jgi:hypothetical protein
MHTNDAIQHINTSGPFLRGKERRRGGAAAKAAMVKNCDEFLCQLIQ